MKSILNLTEECPGPIGNITSTDRPRESMPNSYAIDPLREEALLDTVSVLPFY